MGNNIDLQENDVDSPKFMRPLRKGVATVFELLCGPVSTLLKALAYPYCKRGAFNVENGSVILVSSTCIYEKFRKGFLLKM